MIPTRTDRAAYVQLPCARGQEHHEHGPRGAGLGHEINPIRSRRRPSFPSPNRGYNEEPDGGAGDKVPLDTNVDPFRADEWRDTHAFPASSAFNSGSPFLFSMSPIHEPTSLHFHTESAVRVLRFR